MLHGTSFKKRLGLITEQISLHLSAVINRFGLNKADQVATERFMNNDNVTLEDLNEHLAKPCVRQQLSHALLIQDTSQYNFERHRGRFSDNDPHIGVLGDNKSLGLFVHPTLGVDEATGLPFGITDMMTYHLPVDRKLKKEKDYKNLSITKKWSYRWIRSINDSVAKMPDVELFTALADREADMYELFSHTFDPRVRLLIRSAQNRKLADGQLLHEYLDTLAWQHTYELKIKGNKKKNDRTAQLKIKWTTVEIACPAVIKRREKDCPTTISMQVVEVKEIPNAELKESEEPIHWYLYTTHVITDLEDALQITTWYSQRWWIEDLFRLTKSKGFEIEESQFSTGIALKRLIHLVFGEAVKVLSLRQGRKMVTDNSADLIFDKTELLVLKALLPSLQGRTASQSNLNPQGCMAWAVWTIARLGGWTPRNIDIRPPGVTTLIRGMKVFNQRLQGFKLATAINNFPQQ